MDIELEEREEWNGIRKQLTQTYAYDNIWEQAIELFHIRLKRKFFDPVHSIIQANWLKGEGFTIVTIHCALIETLAAFRAGKIFNHATNKMSPKYEYSRSMDLFVDFLLSVSIFENNFWQYNNRGEKMLNAPYDAVDFYKNVRCGLMHEARTKGNWHITAAPKNKEVKQEKRFIHTDQHKIKIYRTVLHYRLLDYLSTYKEELKQNDKNGKILRRYFARKLDHLFDIKADTDFDWWIDS